MKYSSFKAMARVLSVVLLPAFLLASHASAVSAKTLRGSTKIGSKKERCQARLYKKRGRTYVRGKCVGAINAGLSSKYVAGQRKVKHKGKYKITTWMQRISSRGFTLKIRAYNKKNRKTYRGTVRMR